jgi:CheY-like chemotaxis protein
MTPFLVERWGFVSLRYTSYIQELGFFGLVVSYLNGLVISITKGNWLKPRVLIFEDNDMIRSTLKAILDEMGYEVHTFSNPGMCPIYHGAHHNCLKDHPCSDIIISDINMPFENGLEFIKNRLKKGNKVKFRALMSADWNESNLHHAGNLGCKIISKPFDIEDFLRWIDDCRKKIDDKRVLSDWFALVEKIKYEN